METGSTYKTKSTSRHQTSDWGAPRESDDALLNEYSNPDPTQRLQDSPVGQHEPHNWKNVGRGERLASAIGGAALLVMGRGRSLPFKLALSGLGAALLYRGGRGYCPVNAAIGRNTGGTEEQNAQIEIETSVTVARPRSRVYAFWRNLENLPRVMPHLRHVRQIDNKRSHWIARMPGNMGSLSWDAEILEDVEGELLVWQSVPDALVDNCGEVRFRDGKSPGQTELSLRIRYRPPAGVAGSIVARALNPLFARMVQDDVEAFRKLVESLEPLSAEQL